MTEWEAKKQKLIQKKERLKAYIESRKARLSEIGKSNAVFIENNGKKLSLPTRSEIDEAQSKIYARVASYNGGTYYPNYEDQESKSFVYGFAWLEIFEKLADYGKENSNYSMYDIICSHGYGNFPIEDLKKNEESVLKAESNILQAAESLLCEIEKKIQVIDEIMLYIKRIEDFQSELEVLEKELALFEEKVSEEIKPYRASYLLGNTCKNDEAKTETEKLMVRIEQFGLIDSVLYVMMQGKNDVFWNRITLTSKEATHAYSTIKAEYPDIVAFVEEKVNQFLVEKKSIIESLIKKMKSPFVTENKKIKLKGDYSRLRDELYSTISFRITEDCITRQKALEELKLKRTFLDRMKYNRQHTQSSIKELESIITSLQNQIHFEDVEDDTFLKEKEDNLLTLFEETKSQILKIKATWQNYLKMKEDASLQLEGNKKTIFDYLKYSSTYILETIEKLDEVLNKIDEEILEIKSRRYKAIIEETKEALVNEVIEEIETSGVILTDEQKKQIMKGMKLAQYKDKLIQFRANAATRERTQKETIERNKKISQTNEASNEKHDEERFVIRQKEEEAIEKILKIIKSMQILVAMGIDLTPEQTEELEKCEALVDAEETINQIKASDEKRTIADDPYGMTEEVREVMKAYYEQDSSKKTTPKLR